MAQKSLYGISHTFLTEPSLRSVVSELTGPVALYSQTGCTLITAVNHPYHADYLRFADPVTLMNPVH
ncbi:hypothetical protein [Pedobacter sp. JCM 36344]|uniref:hypothetical protein n=1 Tax=Pedobacter sp. JCM 36344 TaxID=3374280 RepID=UPI003979BE59